MKHFLQQIEFDTDNPIEFIDVTSRVKEVVTESGIQNGFVNVFSNHTTSAVRISESCARLQKDMERLICEIAPYDRPYEHNKNTIDGRDNAHSHLMSLLVGVSETLPVANGKMNLGKWQSIFFIELDGPRKNRSMTVTVLGEK